MMSNDNNNNNIIDDKDEISFGENKSKYSDIEWKTRVKLAAAYRLVAYFKWDEIIYNHLTARIPGTEFILLNPFGLRFDEVTASSLVKLDIEGNIVDEGSSKLGINSTGYVIHGAIHRARQDIESTMHTHVNDIVAVACYKDGLLPISQNSLIVGDVSYHEYEGISVNIEEQGRIIKSLGPVNKCLMLRNHGIVTCGSTIEEAFFLLYQLTKACEIQVRMLSMVGGDVSKLSTISDEIKSLVTRTSHSFTKQGNGKKEFKSLYRIIENIDNSFKN